jgi:hypothetical protein
MDLPVAVRSGTMVQGVSGTNRGTHAAGLRGMADSFFVQFPSPLRVHTLYRPQTPGNPIVNRRERNILHCTRLDFSDFFFSPWISPFILQPLLTALLPRFRSIFDLSRLDPSLFIRLLTLANLRRFLLL